MKFLNIFKFNYRETIIVLVLIILLILFTESFSFYITKYILPFWQKINLEKEIVKICFFILNILIILLLSYDTIKYKLNKNNAFVVKFFFILNIVYCCYRFDIISHSSWNFVPLYKYFLYCDFIFIYFLLELISCIYIQWYKFCEEKKLNISEVSQYDQPKSHEEEDLFNYYPDAKSLATILINIDKPKSNAIVVGVKGEWGRGKTTYLNFLKDVFKNHDLKDSFILVDFKPWFSTNTEQLTADFFSILHQAIKEKPLKNEVAKYAKLIVDIDLGFASKITNILSRKNIEQQFIELNNIISLSKKKIIVFVDDLDRLECDEVMRVIQLIRNIANFHNTYFIVAYDQNYIYKIIENRVIQDPDFYLQKIFTIPHFLPIVEPKALREANKKILIDILMINGKNDQFYVQAFLKDINVNLNIRESILLANDASIIINRLRSDFASICLYDILLLQYLKILNIDVYNSLYTLKYVDHNFATLIMATGEQIELNYKKSMFSFLDNEERLSEEEYIKDRLNIIAKGKNLRECYLILKLLFNNVNLSLFDKNEIIHEYRVKYFSTFNSYFEHSLDNNLIDRDDFIEALNSSPIVFAEKLNLWLYTKNEFILRRLLESVEFKNRDKAMEWLSTSLIIMPKEYYSQQSEGKSLFFLLGYNFFKNSDNFDYKNLYKSIITDFLMKVDDNQEIMVKKLLFTIFINSSETRQVFVNPVLGESTPRYRQIIFLYVKEYLKRLDSYENFNQIYWSVIDTFNFQDRLDIVHIFETHLRENILDFMEYFNPLRLEGSSFIYIFQEYIISGNSASNKGIWKPNFEKFLDSFDESIKSNEIYINFYDGIIKSK